MRMPPSIAAAGSRMVRAQRDLSAMPGKILSLVRNARHIQELLREPRAVGLATANSLVRTVNLVIDSRCNLRCDCCHFFKALEDDAIDRALELPQMLALTDEVPGASVALTGGEPLLSPWRVVDAARTLLRKGRYTMMPTNGLPLADSMHGALVRDVLLNGLDRSERSKLRVQCSIDRVHQRGSPFSLDVYVAKCHAAVRFLLSAGFPVSTRSIVTDGADYGFYREHVLPLAVVGLTCAATVQPDMYNLETFAGALRSGELGDVPARLGRPYVSRILRTVDRAADDEAHAGTSALRSAPWVLIEIDRGGVKGPSGFLPAVAHHRSVLAMLRSYDWLAVGDSIGPQITITKNAFPYRINRATRAVSINLGYVLNRLVHA